MALSNDPVIETRRLTLRPIQASDLEAYYSLRSNPQIMKHSRTHKPDASLEVTRKILEPLICPEGSQEPASGGAYMFAICLRAGLRTGVNAYNTEMAIPAGGMVGSIGTFKFGESASGARCGEIGYMLDTRLWGRGLASEALEAFVKRWKELDSSATTNVGLIAISEVENQASVRVLQKCGFKEERRFVGEELGVNYVEMVLKQ